MSYHVLAKVRKSIHKKNGVSDPVDLNGELFRSLVTSLGPQPYASKGHELPTVPSKNIKSQFYIESDDFTTKTFWSL